MSSTKSSAMHVAAFMLAVAALAVHLFGQTFYGSIVGTVTDASGAVIQGAKATLINSGTGERRSATTDASGNYRFFNLVPGNYSVGVEQSGFMHYTRDQIPVTVEAAVRVDVSMQLGEVTQSVEVTSQAPLLQTENASVGQAVAGRSVEELPLNGRNVLNLVETVPGVVAQGGADGSITGKNVFAAGNYQIGGGTANQSAIYLDGLPLTIMYGNMVAFTPSQDAVAEFRVQTNSNSAEYGRFTGGVINMTSKSGTNGFHGSAYEFLRNTDLNANTFFANKTGAGKTPFHQNQFGGAIAGPVKKDKTFFFASYEGYRQRQGQLFLLTVPTAAQLTGDDSNYRNASGAQIPIYDPQTQCGTGGNGSCPGGVAGNVYSGGPARTPFPGNIIPASRINPVALNFVNFPYWGVPTGPGNQYTHQFNFSTIGSSGGNNDQVNFRVDQNVSDRQRILGRFSRFDTKNQDPKPYNNGISGGTPEQFTTDMGVLADTYSLNPSTTLDVRAGFMRWNYSRVPGTTGLNISQKLGLPSYYNQLDTLRGLTGSTTIPTLSVSGYNNVGTGLIYGVVNTYVLAPSLIKVIGRHTLKFGAEVRRMDFNYYQDNSAGGNFGFSNLFTSQNALSPGATGDALASFLLGLPASGQVQSSLFSAAGMHYQGYYANDSFQAAGKLMVNLGVRWEVPGVYTERYDRQDVFNPTEVNPVLAKAGITVNGAPVLGAYDLVNSQQHPVRGLTPEHWHLFAPRAGLAYRLTETTVLRAGGGMFFLPADAVFPEGPCQAAVTYLYNTMVPSLDGDVTALNTLSNPYPNGFVGMPQRDPAYQADLLGLANIRAPLGNHPYPYTWQWNFTVQHQFPKDVALEVGYTGLRGLHLPRGNPAAQYDVIPGSTITSLGSQLLQQVPNPFYGVIPNGTLAQPTVQRGQLLLPFPQYLSLYDYAGYNGDSIYDSLQVKAEKRLGSGGMVLVGYTFSKSIGNSETFSSWLESTPGLGQTQDFTNLKPERALSQFDSRQRLTLSYILDLPVGKGKRFLPGVKGAADKLVSGWGINGLSSFQEGFPLALLASPNLTGLNTGLRPNVAAGCNKTIGGAAQARLSQWFNTSCFSVPGIFTFGSESRTDPNLRGAGINNFDVAVFKRTAITERFNLEFRAEFFNLFNRVQFGYPNTTDTTAANSTFGLVSSQLNSPRLIQLALRLRF